MEIQAERTWLGIGVSLGVAGAALIASTAAASPPIVSNPALYIGSALGLIAIYVGFGVFVARVPLPKLPSERSFERLQHGLAAVIAEGWALDQRNISSDDEWAEWQADHSHWVARVHGWLSAEVSPALATAFAHPTPRAGDIIPSYHPDHSKLRLFLRWCLDWLQGLG